MEGSLAEAQAENTRLNEELLQNSEIFEQERKSLKGKCALGPFLSILVTECKHKGLNVNLCTWMNKVKIMK
jgi:hypothetical protein